MKQLLKLIFISTLFTAISFGHAQSQQTGIIGGFSISNMLIENDVNDAGEFNDQLSGLHFGLSRSFALNDLLTLEPMLFASWKGYESERETNDILVKVKERPIYLDLPVYMKLTFNLSENVRCFGSLGPYIGYGISGNTTISVESSLGSDELSEAISWGNDPAEDRFRRFDAGISAGGGILLDQIGLGAYYDHGMVNVSPVEVNGVNQRHRVFRISLSYYVN